MNRRFLAALALLCCGSVAMIAQAELVSYWPFDEFNNEMTTPDVVSGYDLEVEGATFGNDNHVDGKIGKAFEFFSADQSLLRRLHEPDDKLPINKQPNWTISMWAKVEGTGQNDLRLLSEASTTDNDPLFNIGTANNGNNGTLDIYIRNAQANTGTVSHPRTTAEPFNGEWSHIGWTFSDGMHNIYIDGVYDSSYAMQSFGEIDPFQLDNTTIGGIQRAATSHFVTGVIDEVAMWDEVLPGNALIGLALGKTTPLEALNFSEAILPRLPVAGDDLGTLGLSGEVSDIVKGDPKETQGLSQYWIDGNLRGATAVENYQSIGETGTETFPLATAGPFASSTTWWSGNGALTVRGEALPQYPAGLAGTRFDGSANEENYGVILRGEVFIPADGEYLIRDGIDDFAMVAIDQDGNGELDDFAGIVDADVGTLGPFNNIGDVLVLDDAWSSVAGGNQTEAEHAIAEFENVDADGEWRKIEIWMGEAGGGDSGTLYMGSLDDPDIFDELNGGDLTQEEIDKFLIPNDQLRTTVAQIESGNSKSSLRTDVEYVIQVAADGNDQIDVGDNGGVYNTTLDLTDATIRIEAADGLTEGTWTIFGADNVIGLDSATFLFDDESKWDLTNIGSGQLTLGEVISLCNPNSGGDLDGNGKVEFADFLVLAENFGKDATDHTTGDIDCNGKVEFSDFLKLAENFGNSVGQASAVPEPSGFALISIAGLLGGWIRRRRR